jgi:hypothetical protein
VACGPRGYSAGFPVRSESLLAIESIDRQNALELKRIRLRASPRLVTIDLTMHVVTSQQHFFQGVYALHVETQECLVAEALGDLYADSITLSRSYSPYFMPQ